MFVGPVSGLVAKQAAALSRLLFKWFLTNLAKYHILSAKCLKSGFTLCFLELTHQQTQEE